MLDIGVPLMTETCGIQNVTSNLSTQAAFRKTTEWKEWHSSLGGEIGPPCPLKVLRLAGWSCNDTVWGQAWPSNYWARDSQSGPLLGKVNVSTVHSERKCWLMSLRLFPVVKRHPGMFKWPLHLFCSLACQWWRLLVGFLKVYIGLSLSLLS